MITLITSSRNSGKSSRFLRLYRESGSKDIGLFSLKLLDTAGHTIGYDLCLLPGDEQLPLARLSAAPPCFMLDDCLYQGRFVFSRLAFEYASSYVLRQSPSVAAASSAIWIDEIGQLELRGLGYASLLQQLIEKQTDMILTIRDRYLAAFLSKYQIDNFLIL